MNHSTTNLMNHSTTNPMNHTFSSRRKATIQLSYQRMAYDLSNYAYIVGDAMPETSPGASPHAVHLVQDVMQGQNRDRLDRVLDTAFRQLRGLLVPFLDEEGQAEEPHGVSAPSHDDYSIRMAVPPSVTKAHVDLWSILAYEFMVASALADWLGICAPSVAQVWADRRDTDWQQLAQSVKVHNRRARTTLNPF